MPDTTTSDAGGSSAPRWLSSTATKLAAQTGKLFSVLGFSDGGEVWSDNILESLKTWQNKGTVAQLQAHLAKTKGTKDESDWIGLGDFLTGKESVTRDEVEQYVQANQVQIHEVIHGGESSASGLTRDEYMQESDRLNQEAEASFYRANAALTEAGLMSAEGNRFLMKPGTKHYEQAQSLGLSGLIDDYQSTLDRLQDHHDKDDFQHNAETKFSQYVVPGATEGSYRELLLTLPESVKTETRYFVKDADGNVVANSSTESAAKQYMKEGRRIEVVERPVSGQRGDNFKSSHFDEPNILAHVRYNDRVDTEGKKTLFIEEVQSDWGQQLRKSLPLREVRKPESIGKLGNNFFGRELASAMSLNEMDAGMLALANHDQVARSIVSLLPVDVVDELGGSELLSKKLLSNPSMIFDSLAADRRATVSQVVLDSSRQAFAKIRAELASGFQAGSDVEILPALRASQLTSREIVSVLSPESIYHPSLPSQTVGFDVARGGTEKTSFARLAQGNEKRTPATDAEFLNSPTFAGIGAKSFVGSTAQSSFKPLATSVAKALDWHNRIQVESGTSKAVSYLPSSAPSMPMSATWPMLAMKRMVRYASDEGYDQIAWTTGEQQAERYDLSKQVDSISYQKLTDDNYAIDVRKERESVLKREATSGELESIVGKDIAAKITSGHGYEEGAPKGSGELRGVDLKIGGAGMKAFYDKMLPAEMNKLAKKWGTSVGTTKINKGDSFEQWAEKVYPGSEVEPWMRDNWHGGDTTAVHSLPITPQMREAAAKGFMPFATGGMVPSAVSGFSDHQDEMPQPVAKSRGFAFGGLLDIVQSGLDAAGVADPTGIFDLTNAGISLFRAATDRGRRKEHLVNAGINAVSAIPGGMGDFAKLLKTRQYAHAFEAVAGIGGKAPQTVQFPDLPPVGFAVGGKAGKRLGKGWVFHNTKSDDLPKIAAEGLSGGSFSASPGFDFGGDAWLAVQESELPNVQRHKYGEIEAIEPGWGVDEDGNDLHVIPPHKVMVVDKRGRLLQSLAEMQADEPKGFADGGILSPEFKNWFGDWEAAQAQSDHRHFLEGEPVVRLTGDEVPTFSKVSQLAEWAGNWLESEHGGKATHPVLGEVTLNHRTAKDSVGHGMNPDKAAAFSALPSIIQQGIITGEKFDTDDENKSYHVVMAPITIRDEPFVGVAGVRRDANGQRAYLHQVHSTKKLQDSYKPWLSPKRSYTDQNLGVIQTVLQELFGVNENPSSKIIGKDGEPLKVFHGTDRSVEQFDVFGGNDFGSHFGTVEQANDRASRSEGLVIPAYLSAKNPLRLPDLERWDYDTMQPELAKHGIDVPKVEHQIETADRAENYKRTFRRQNEAIGQAINEAGYDGIVYQNSYEGQDQEPADSFIVWNPTQIKSTFNRGTWSPDDDRIGYAHGGNVARNPDGTFASGDGIPGVPGTSESPIWAALRRAGNWAKRTVGNIASTAMRFIALEGFAGGGNVAREPVSAVSPFFAEQSQLPGFVHPATLKPEQLFKASELEAAYKANYLDASGNKIASSRTTPVTSMPDVPVGSWRTEDRYKGNYGSDLSQLAWLDPGKLEVSEHEIGSAWGRDRLEDAERYAGWMQEGRQAPPIEVVETDNGKLKVSDGHRRHHAAKLAGQKILAWVSPNADTGGRTPLGQPITTALTDQLATQDFSRSTLGYATGGNVFQRGLRKAASACRKFDPLGFALGGKADEPIPAKFEEWSDVLVAFADKAHAEEGNADGESDEARQWDEPASEDDLKRIAKDGFDSYSWGSVDSLKKGIRWAAQDHHARGWEREEDRQRDIRYAESDAITAKQYTLAQLIEKTIPGASFGVSGGGSQYATLNRKNDLPIKLRIADHHQVEGGGFNEGSQSRMGESDISWVVDSPLSELPSQDEIYRTVLDKMHQMDRVANYDADTHSTNLSLPEVPLFDLDVPLRLDTQRQQRIADIEQRDRANKESAINSNRIAALLNIKGGKDRQSPAWKAFFKARPTSFHAADLSQLDAAEKLLETAMAETSQGFARGGSITQAASNVVVPQHSFGQRLAKLFGIKDRIVDPINVGHDLSERGANLDATKSGLVFRDQLADESRLAGVDHENLGVGNASRVINQPFGNHGDIPSSTDSVGKPQGFALGGQSDGVMAKLQTGEVALGHGDQQKLASLAGEPAAALFADAGVPGFTGGGQSGTNPPSPTDTVTAKLKPGTVILNQRQQDHIERRTGISTKLEFPQSIVSGGVFAGGFSDGGEIPDQDKLFGDAVPAMQALGWPTRNIDRMLKGVRGQTFRSLDELLAAALPPEAGAAHPKSRDWKPSPDKPSVKNLYHDILGIDTAKPLPHELIGSQPGAFDKDEYQRRVQEVKAYASHDDYKHQAAAILNEMASARIAVESPAATFAEKAIPSVVKADATESVGIQKINTSSDIITAEGGIMLDEGQKLFPETATAVVSADVPTAKPDAPKDTAKTPKRPGGDIHGDINHVVNEKLNPLASSLDNLTATLEGVAAAADKANAALKTHEQLESEYATADSAAKEYQKKFDETPVGKRTDEQRAERDRLNKAADEANAARLEPIKSAGVVAFVGGKVDQATALIPPPVVQSRGRRKDSLRNTLTGLAVMRGRRFFSSSKLGKAILAAPSITVFGNKVNPRVAVRQLKKAARTVGGRVAINSALGFIGGGPLGSAGGVVGSLVGGAAGATIGAAATGVGFLASMALAANGVTKAFLASAQATNEANRSLGAFNGSIAGAFARLDAARIKREQEVGRATSGTAGALAEAVNQAEEARQPLRAIGTDMSNIGGIMAAKTSGFLSEILISISDISGFTSAIKDIAGVIAVNTKKDGLNSGERLFEAMGGMPDPVLRRDAAKNPAPRPAPGPDPNAGKFENWGQGIFMGHVDQHRKMQNGQRPMLPPAESALV